MTFWGIIVGLPALAPAVQRQGVVTSPSNPGDGVPQSIAVGSTTHYVTREWLVLTQTSCTKCAYKSATIQNLARHARTHTGERPFT